jgi:hypothetical protein
MGQIIEVKYVFILFILIVTFSACRKELSFDLKNLTSELEEKLDDINARKIIIVSQSDEIINFILNTRLEDGDRIDIDSYNRFFALLTPFDKQIEFCNRSINDANKLIKKLIESGVEFNIDNQQISTIGFLFKDDANAKIEEMINQYILKNNLTESGKKKIYSFIKIAFE